MTQLRITGMTCGHCSSHVKKAIEKVPGVTSAEVDLASGLARIEGKAAAAELVAAVQAEGYQALEMAE
jgi:copper chaperone CopZ